MTVPEWSGRRVMQARTFMERKLPAMCEADVHKPGCPGVLDGSEPWVVGHRLSRIERPDLTWVPNNWRHEARVCSDASGQAAVIAKARADVVRELTAAGKIRDEKISDDDDDENSDSVFSDAPTLLEVPLLPFSLPGGHEGDTLKRRPRVTATSKAAPQAINSEPLHIRDDLRWDTERVRAYPWLADLADVPDDASPPLAMTYPTDDAVCSYGWDGCTHMDGEPGIVTWAEREHNYTLRWWQRLAIVRQHEHRADGSLTWTTDVESASRRSGKSHRLRAVATWRLSHAALIGEVQSVVHCGNDLAVCRDVQSKAWRWARTRWGADAVKTGNGKEVIQNPHDDSSWVVKAQGAAYGMDAGLTMVDEGWDVKPDTVSEGLEPMLLDRLWAQNLMTSTAHRRARSTMKTRITGCLMMDDGETLLLWWGALPQDDPGDPATWRKASPHWTEHRRKMMADKYEKALMGEEDPEADDPDPMEGFRAQYLNVWSLRTAGRVRGEPVVDKAAWSELAVNVPDRAPDGMAIESHFDAGMSVACAWRLPDGAALVRVVPVDDLAAAALIPTQVGYRGVLTVGSSMVGDPALRGLRIEKGTGQALSAVLELSRLLAEGQFAHDGSPGFSSQVLAVRTVPAAGGRRLASQGRVDGVKAAMWAANTARRRAPRPARRVLMPTV